MRSDCVRCEKKTCWQKNSGAWRLHIMGGDVELLDPIPASPPTVFENGDSHEKAFESGLTGGHDRIGGWMLRHVRPRRMRTSQRLRALCGAPDGSVCTAL